MSAETAEASQPGWLEADGRRLECAWWPGADAGGTPLVLLHEGLGCVAMWREFPALLAAHTGRTVFAYSRAGYGASDPAPLPRGVDYMHHEALVVLPQVLGAAGIDRCVLLGHSDGGSIALIYAGGARDLRAESLVLFAPHVFNEQVCVDSIRRARDAYTQTDLRERLARYHGAQVDAAFRGWNDIWLHPDFWHWNIEDSLALIAQPVLVVQGCDDEYGTLAQLDAIARGLPQGCERRLLAGCGHSPHRDQPEATLAAVGGFLGGRVRE